jgi:Domain of unknown function (DUF1905)
VTLELNFISEVIYWRGPSPFYFVRVPDPEAIAINNISKQVSYGWGVIPCDIKIGSIEFYTALFPKDGSYLVPLKKVVRESASIELGDNVEINIQIRYGLQGV